MIVFVKKVHFLALLLLTVSDILAADLYHNYYATLEDQQADVAERKAILEDCSGVIDPKPKEPQTRGCLRGCRNLPCDEAARCVMRNCPNVRIKCDDGEHGVFIGDESLKRVEKQQHDEIQEKINTHAECVKSQNVDILKDSVRFEAVFDSCWRERMKGL